MNAKDINQSYDLLMLAQGDTNLKAAGHYFIGACPFCGGTDRFNLTQKADGWRWLCRNCTDTKYKSPIDYVMRRDGLNFKQALEILGGIYSTPAPAPHAKFPKPEAPSIVLPDSTWQAQHWHEVTQACEALTTNKSARAYLELRSLNPSTWNMYLLGFVMVFDPKTQIKRAAISIPWYDSDETITAIKYRFIDDLAKDKSYRYTMAKGSKQILFGMHITSGNEMLILTEGEFNAASITQITAHESLNIDAFSFGSETATHADILRTVANDYQRVIVWADNPDHANAIRLSLNRSADALCSPEIDGVKYDANTLLQKGYLARFLQETIKGSGSPIK